MTLQTIQDFYEHSFTSYNRFTFSVDMFALLKEEEFEGIKRVIRIRISKNTMAKRKSTKGHTTIYKTYIQTKDRVTRTLLTTGGELRCSGSVSSSCSTSDTRRIKCSFLKGN